MISLVACTTTVEKRIPFPVSVHLNAPDRPSFTKVLNSDVECLSEDSKKKILARDFEMKSYMGELEDIIKGNNEVADKPMTINVK